MSPEGSRRRRRLLRIGWIGLAALTLLHGVAVLCGIPIAGPFDVVVNLGPTPVVEGLRVPADGKRRVVVLQHGLWRTAASLGRLERTLRAHGYEVWNPGYPSVRGTIEEHAELLHRAVESICAEPVDELSFVGHSMGGLVIQEYLRRSDARPATACVYLATPHRGAVLADLRKHWFLFRLAMGSRAALQLSPGAPIHSRPIPLPGSSGNLVGDVGEGNSSIPGADDGTVAVGEATFAGARDSLTLPFGHTSITFEPEAIVQVLHFLRHRAFAHDGIQR